MNSSGPEDQRGDARGLPAALAALRPKQWSKNVFVFAALIFTRQWSNGSAIAGTLAAFAAMSLAGSATYLLNDLVDRKADQAHPRKRLRPIASGRVSLQTAIGMALFCAGAAIGIASQFGILPVILGYLGLQLLYNWRLKREAVADVVTIAFGFVLRVVAGALAIAAPVSAWILLCTGFLALLLGFGKRRHELRLMGENGGTRVALGGYTEGSLDLFLGVSAAAAILSYAVYSIESTTARMFPGLFLTTPFVAYGVFRYLLLVQSPEVGGEPEHLIFGDPQLIVVLLGFLATAFAALSGFHPAIIR